MKGVRVRFAPSPTGALHLGNVRTALYNYLYAKRHRGKFIFRIEDTDRERSSAELEQGIIDNMGWLGIIPDEGIGPGGPQAPYRQTDRGEIYSRHFDQLLEQGDVYPCFCTPEELEAEREATKRKGRAYQYSGRCRDLSAEKRTKFENESRRPTLRFRVPDEGELSFTDEIRGPITFQLQDIGDFVIRRSDGSPLYNVANVIDDALMQISHVIRGEEFISTTPTQVLLGQALDLPIPHFAHLPLLLSPSGGKLSKREASVAVQGYRDQGYLAEAMVNFLVLLGWSPPGEEDFFSLSQLEQLFDFDHVQKGGSQVDFDKLKHLNGRHLRALTVPELTDRLLKEEFIPTEWGGDRPKLERAAATVQERLETLAGAADLLRFYFEPIEIPDFDRRELASHLRELTEELGSADFDQLEALHLFLGEFLAKRDLTPRQLFPALRLILTGQKASPGIHQLLWALGRQESIRRLKTALD